MTTDALSPLIRSAALGATQAAARLPDVECFEAVSAFVGEQLAAGSDDTLAGFGERLRREAPIALPWYLTILRTLAGTVTERRLMHHLVLVPVCTAESLDQALVLGVARHEIEGSLESALNLGEGTLRLLPVAASFATLESMTPTQWRALASGQADSDGPLLAEAPLAAPGGALLGRWSIERTDLPRLRRKLVHAAQRTPALVSCQQRVEALLEERANGARLSLYPAFQLQDFFTGFRQIHLMRELEAAYRALPAATTLAWRWDARTLVVALQSPAGEQRLLAVSFPDEAEDLALARLKGFADRRQLVADPPITGA